MTITLALAGDTMLGRGVAERLSSLPPQRLFADELAALTRAADLFVLNLECCVSERGEPWPAPGKPFFFRAPPAAVEALAHVGVDAVTLANNHALDFGHEALTDTLSHLRRAGITVAGAGADLTTARRPAVLEAGGLRLAVVGVADHPPDFAAASDRPGIAYADLRRGLPSWLRTVIAGADADLLMVGPHWGPNMVAEPVAHVRSAAAAMVAAGADLVAGHSAHVFHGVARAGRSAAVLFDLGDFIDDYAVDPRLRNDLGLLWLVELDTAGPRRLEAVPIRLDYASTRLAVGADAAWVGRRLRRACERLGTEVVEHDGRLGVALR